MVEIKSYIQWKNRVYNSIICGNNFLESAPQKKKKTKSFIKTLKIPVF